MAQPLLEEESLLREWAPLTDLLQQIPVKAQRGIFTHELNLTCVDILPEFIAVGTSLGLVYWYCRRKGDLQRLRCENTASAITCLKIVSTVDYMVAAGNDQGVVTVFQVPKSHPDCIPESLKPKKNKQVERYTISGLHSTPVTAIEWSVNGMKLFSGDKNGLVVLTEIDFYMHLSKSVELLNEKYEIVQLSYNQQLLLVSTVYRSIVCHREDRWKVIQVGQKERKILGKLGATFCPGTGKPQDVIIYASRPGLRLWRSDKTGVVQQTLIYKDALSVPHPEAPLITPAPVHVRLSRGEPTFGRLHLFREKFLVTYGAGAIYVLDPTSIRVVATVADVRAVRDVAVGRDEIFILEGERSLIRVAPAPDLFLTSFQGARTDQSQTGSAFTSIPVSLPDITMVSSLFGLTTKIKDTANMPTIPFQNLFSNSVLELGNSSTHMDQADQNPIVTADEAVELPPIVHIPLDSLINLETQPGIDYTASEHKVLKEVYNRSQQSTLETRNRSQNSRGEVLDKIGEQDFENILFKPKAKRKVSKGKKIKKTLSGAESGSDTVSTNSVHSVTSEGEDMWSSERLDVSCDWSNNSTKHSSNMLEQALYCVDRSQSEETLVRLSDSITSDLGTLPDDEDASVGVNFIRDIISSNHVERPDTLTTMKNSNDGPFLPDLRSPATIERDVEDKEKILAKVLDLETLCVDHILKVPEPSKTSTDKHFTDILSEELSHNVCINDVKSEECENHCIVNEIQLEQNTQDDSLDSVLSYGPPSGSSAPPSSFTSLEVFESSGNTNSINNAVERADKWMQYKVPDMIANLSVCHHYVCCIDYKDSVYYSGLTGFGLKWQKVDYKSKQVAFSMSGSIVWKLVKDIAYALENPLSKGPFGDVWHEAASDIQFIAVDEGIVWLVSVDGLISVQKHLSCNNPRSMSVPIFCPWLVSRISCYKGAVWALTEVGEVIARIGITKETPEGKDWRRIVTPCTVAGNIAVGDQKSGWIMDTKSGMYFTNDYSTPHPKWWQILISDYIFLQSTTLQQFRNRLADNYLLNLRTNAAPLISLGKDTIWIAEKSATSIHMNKTEFTGHHWNKQALKCYLPSTKWQEISAEGIFETKGQLWLLSTSGDLFFMPSNSDSLHAVGVPSDSSVACIAASPQSLWLLSTTGKIYVCQGLSDAFFGDLTWKELNLNQISGVHLTHISCGCDVVWACDMLGAVYMAIGSPHSMASSMFSPVWIMVDEKPQRNIFFSKVFVGPHTYMVWAVDNKMNVYVREAIFNDFQIGIGWVLVSGIEASQLSISASAVWALSPKGNIYRRYGINQNNYIGDYWKQIPGSVASITASASDDLWALERNMGLLKHTQLTVNLSTANDTSCAKDPSAGSCSEDWDWEVL